MREIWIAHRKNKQMRHRAWKIINLEMLCASGIPFINKGETLLFREEGLPAVDFYPSTGRWRVGNAFFSGGAKRFLVWYGEQRECQKQLN